MFIPQGFASKTSAKEKKKANLLGSQLGIKRCNKSNPHAISLFLLFVGQVLNKRAHHAHRSTRRARFALLVPNSFSNNDVFVLSNTKLGSAYIL